ncbi:MAG: 4-hydroxy-3-methylbut-2-enyl diphosphate reductase [Desulfobacterales bacterium]|nr:4-hydroxy-3-methylbut-2-enyl diphosphate reductase [Desulfobacterales bacterium]
MKIIIARTAGFCMGVRRAVDMALDAATRSKKNIYTYGPLIHNPQVLSLLEEKQISVISDIPNKGDGTVLIRAHGVPPDIKDKLADVGFDVIDATCPRVIKVQTIIDSHCKKGYIPIIVGNENHPEVIGLLGFAGNKGIVVDNLEGLKSLPIFEKAIIVAQTTQNRFLFDEIKKYIVEKHPSYKIFNTICDSTEKRQAEVRELSKLADAFIVVGGYDSGNTKRLAEVATSSGKPAFHIETESELEVNDLSLAETIGITAGASTPNWIIKRVYRHLENILYNRKKGWRKTLFEIQRIFLYSNLYLALGALCLCYTCSKLQGLEYNFPHLLVAMTYVLSMHITNNIIGVKEEIYNDPDRAYFYEKNKIKLIFLALSSGIIGLVLSCLEGFLPFLILLAMSIMGIGYNFRLIPKKVSINKVRRIRDIPGSKTILLSAAWGIVTAIFPVLFESKAIDSTTLFVFLWSTSLVFVRTSFFDILSIQGNRIVGKETIPILLGEDRSIYLLKFMLGLILIMQIIASILHITTPLGYALTLYPIFMFAVLIAQENKYLLPGVKQEFYVENLFAITGLISFIWFNF